MIKHLEQGLIGSLRTGKAGSIAGHAAEEHLDTCSQCREVVARHPDIRASAASLFDAAIHEENPIEHPDYERIVAYCDEEMSTAGRDEVESHLEVCARCSDDVADLKRLQAQLGQNRAAARWVLRPSRRRVFLWASVAAAAILFVVVTIERRAPPYATVGAPGGTVIHDGIHQLVIGKGGAVSGLDFGDRDWNERVRAALLSGSLAGPQHAGALPPEESLRGASVDEAFRVISPLDVAVEDEHPTFTWSPIEGAAYRVTVVAGDQTACESPLVREGVWRSTVALPRGRDYVWQVAAQVGEKRMVAPRPTAPFARFRVLSEAHEAEIQRARVTSTNSHLLIGLLYAADGVTDRAEEELEQLAKENPRSPAAQRLLRSIRGRLSRPAPATRTVPRLDER